jgi:hypothetical protein
VYGVAGVYGAAYGTKLGHTDGVADGVAGVDGVDGVDGVTGVGGIKHVPLRTEPSGEHGCPI